MAQKKYDVAVIGGGISGLLVAQGLQKMGREVALLDIKESMGGNCRPLETSFGSFEMGLKLHPNNQTTVSALRVLSGFLKSPLRWEERTEPPLTYLKGHLEPFFGFGEKAPASASELHYYLSTDLLELNLGVKDWIRDLTSGFSGQILGQSRVNELHLEGKKITKLVLNGSEEIAANDFVYCAPLRDLPGLLPKSALPARMVQKISKTPLWTAIALDVIHAKPVTDCRAVHLLMAGTDDAIPSVGRFNRPLANGSQHSQWLTLVMEEATHEEEVTGHAIREMKKQIRRAYGEAFSNVQYERLSVFPRSHGQIHLKLDEYGHLGHISNLWIGCGQAHSAPNLSGAILQAQHILESLSGDAGSGTHIALPAQDLPC